MRPLALSSETFRALAQEVSNFAADHLQELRHLPSYPREISGPETEELFGGDMPWQATGLAAFDALPKVFEYSRKASPRFFGYVFGSASR